MSTAVDPSSVNPSSEDVRQEQDMACRIIKHHFGTKPQHVEHQTSGISNFVFLVEHDEGNFVVRISPEPDKIHTYRKEQWAVARVRERGVPTAEILEIGKEIIPCPYMVSRCVGGQEASQHEDRLPIVREMGRYAALINSIPTIGFGHVFDWADEHIPRNATWSEFLEREFKLELYLEVLQRHRMLTPSQLLQLRLILEGLADKPLETRLNHGDMRLKNVIVDENGKITAIIDWEHCVSNLAPHWELSIALHDLSIDEKEEFMRGYGLPNDQLIEIAPVLSALNIINYTPYIEEAAKSNDGAQLANYRTRLSGAFDLYST
jgi:aminoglycoside phosphotransferase (APT) family kinase protein